jgi:hypothetical protein
MCRKWSYPLKRRTRPFENRALPLIATTSNVPSSRLPERRLIHCSKQVSNSDGLSVIKTRPMVACEGTPDGNSSRAFNPASLLLAQTPIALGPSAPVITAMMLITIYITEQMPMVNLRRRIGQFSKVFEYVFNTDFSRFLLGHVTVSDRRFENKMSTEQMIADSSQLRYSKPPKVRVAQQNSPQR